MDRELSILSTTISLLAPQLCTNKQSFKKKSQLGQQEAVLCRQNTPRRGKKFLAYSIHLLAQRPTKTSFWVVDRENVCRQKVVNLLIFADTSFIDNGIIRHWHCQALCPTLIKNELIPMPNFTRLKEVDRVVGFEPTTSATTAA